jgi:neutral ceramidase
MSAFRFGQAQAVITPPIGTPLSGFEERDHGAEGVHDDLWAKAWVFEGDGGRVALAFLDLVGVDREMVREIRAQVSAATELKPHDIHLVCTHTHSGPSGLRKAVPFLASPFTEDPELVSVYVRYIAGALIRAFRSLHPGRIGFGTGLLSTMCTNRRDPSGPMDPAVQVIRVEEADGALAGVIVNYANHPTTLNAENYLVTRDFPGFMCDAVTRVHGGSVQVAYAQGAAGDISARWTRRATTFAEADRLGTMLAGEALRVLAMVESSPELKVRVLSRDFTVPTRRYPPVAEAEHRLAEATERLERLKVSGAPYGDVRTAYVSWQGADRTARMARIQRPDMMVAEAGLIALGELKIALLPGEAMTRTGLELKEGLRRPSMVFAYANDYVGYLVPSADEAEGGYEAGASFLSAAAVDQLRDGVLALAQEI